MKRKKATKEFVPKALRQVWEWKAASYREVAHLPTRDAPLKSNFLSVQDRHRPPGPPPRILLGEQ